MKVCLLLLPLRVWSHITPFHTPAMQQPGGGPHLLQLIVSGGRCDRCFYQQALDACFHAFCSSFETLQNVFAAAMNNINFNWKCRYNSRLFASKECQYLLQLFWKLVILIHVLYMNNLKIFNVFSICEQLQTYFLVFPRTVCG